MKVVRAPDLGGKQSRRSPWGTGIRSADSVPAIGVDTKRNYLAPASPRMPAAVRNAAALGLNADIAAAERAGKGHRAAIRGFLACCKRKEPAAYRQSDIRNELSDAKLGAAAFVGLTFRARNGYSG